MQKWKREGVCVFAVCCVLPTLLREVAAEAKQYNRYNFPSDFIFGASTSAYQVEGAALQDGRTPSIYDTFAHLSGDYIQNPDVSCDEYHKYKEDVQLMVETGLDAYRFSISWSRLIPSGRGPINPNGLRYYNNLINELITHGIEPHVTLVHSDVPQILEDEYGSFLDPGIIDDFTTYVDVCFREFGDRVRYWTTFNEPNIFVFGGYDVGNTPPSRCSSPFGLNCTEGNSTMEPYLAAHHLLLAHASAARLYKTKYQAKQLGFIGINLLSFHFKPFTNTSEDIKSARRAYDFMMGWLSSTLLLDQRKKMFMHPLTYGDYPHIMKKNAGNRIPVFTKNQSNTVKGSFDFVGINYYAAIITKDNSNGLSTKPRDFFQDMEVEWIYPNTSASKEVVFSNQPWGMERVLEYYKDAYENPLIFIHENGQAAIYNTSIVDAFRIEYLHDHIWSLLKAVRNGSNTKGYFVWSLLDVYELLFGFDYTFGLYYVNFSDPNLSRHPKMSQKWYSAFLKGKNVTLDDENNHLENTTINLRFSASVGDSEVLSRHPKLLHHMSS